MRGDTNGWTHVGTAGATLDLSVTLGVLSSRSSFSRRFFSVETIRLDAMIWDWRRLGECESAPEHPWLRILGEVDSLSRSSVPFRASLKI